MPPPSVPAVLPVMVLLPAAYRGCRRLLMRPPAASRTQATAE
jgi:hypothetical protein